MKSKEKKKKTTEELLVEVKLQWFTDKIRFAGLYSRTLENAYELYLEDRITEEITEKNKAFEECNLYNILKDLMNFIDWWDHDSGANENEKLIKGDMQCEEFCI